MFMLFLSTVLAAEPGDAPAADAPSEDMIAVDAMKYPWEPGLDLPGVVGPGSPHWDLEVLYMSGEVKKGLEQAKAEVAANPNDADLYWHIVRFMYEVGELFDPEDKTIDRDAFYSEMLEWCDKGLVVSPGNPHIRFGRGIAMGRLGTTRGILSSLGMALDIEQDWIAAAEGGLVYATPDGKEILPCDNYQALGMYYRMVPDWWIVGVIAGVRGDMTKSVEWLEKADACSPNTIRNLKELGISQVCLGTKMGDVAMVQKGQGTLARASALPPRYEIEAIDVRHSAMVMSKPDMACEYSRDGQLKLDEAELEGR